MMGNIDEGRDADEGLLVERPWPKSLSAESVGIQATLLVSLRERGILDSFDHHAPSPIQTGRIELMRAQFKLLATHIIAVVPDGADRSAALRQLHESMMTTNKAIVLGPAPDVPAPAPQNHDDPGPRPRS